MNRGIAIFTQHLGIDLGTTNTLVFSKGEGIIINEPSVVAIHEADGKLMAVGNEAKQMLGRAPGAIKAIRPMRDGVIADFEVTRSMLKYFVRKTRARRPFARKMQVVICIPFGVTATERQAIEVATISAGVPPRSVALIEEPMAAAIGASLPISDPRGSMVVDIGGGTSEVAVLALGGIVESKSLRTAGDELDEAITNYCRREYSVAIGERTAEDVKMRIGCACDPDSSNTTEIRGRDLVSGLPRVIRLSEKEMQQAMGESIRKFIDTIKSTLKTTPPELVSDVMEEGIVLAGGGALIRRLDILITRETGIPVRIASNPLYCVIDGIGRVLEHYKELRNVLLT